MCNTKNFELSEFKVELGQSQRTESWASFEVTYLRMHPSSCFIAKKKKKKMIVCRTRFHVCVLLRSFSYTDYWRGLSASISYCNRCFNVVCNVLHPCSIYVASGHQSEHSLAFFLNCGCILFFIFFRISNKGIGFEVS